MKKITPEQQLVDALYDLQSAHQRATFIFSDYSDGEIQDNTEPAIFPCDDKIIERCSVFTNTKTSDRIILSPLPLDQDDFKEAHLWLSNLDDGITLPEGLVDEKYRPKDVVFYIGKTAMPLLRDPQKEEVLVVEPELLVDMLNIPKKMLPLPLSEYDPRDIPSEIELVTVPKTDTYTLASGIWDSEVETNLSLIAKRSGFVKYSQFDLTKYEIEIIETLPSEHSYRSDEFDRDFILQIQLDKLFNFNVTPWGESESVIVGDKLKIRAVREGILAYATRDGKEISCIPCDSVKQLIDDILGNASVS